jgi:glycosyltransferase involved in cell wall biosynthesis
VLKLAVTGFVSDQAGSVASANALLLRELLLRGHEIHFFSKASFVDPRPAVGNPPGFRFFNVTNAGPDQFRRRVEKIPFVGWPAGLFDAWTYNRMLVREMARAHLAENYNLSLWLGEFARGRTPGIPVVSFVQGPPGTDARSVLQRFDEIKALAGSANAMQWLLLAKLRLSRVGLPPLELTDRFIVGSQVSKRTLSARYGIAQDCIDTLPYPIDLELFALPDNAKATGGNGVGGPLRVCWLGRIIPRKRLDLFLEGAESAIRQGIDVRLTIIGGIGFIPGYDKMIEAFPFRDRLTWKKSISRQEVPSLLRAHDVLVQPSDEENFGSSVAEAQACGLPVIVGHTNGNADYLCSRDIHLSDDRPETLANALREMAQRKVECRWGDPGISRQCAEQHFSLDKVTTSLLELLESLEPVRR